MHGAHFRLAQVNIDTASNNIEETIPVALMIAKLSSCSAINWSFFCRLQGRKAVLEAVFRVPKYLLHRLSLSHRWPIKKVVLGRDNVIYLDPAIYTL